MFKGNAYATCQLCEEGCKGKPEKIRMWMKLHYKAVHNQKFQGIDFHSTEKRQIKRTPTKDDYMQNNAQVKMLKETTETLDYIQMKNS